MYESIGKKYNKLTVIKYISREEGYLCECDCGNYVVARLWSLKNNKHKSCGCVPRKIKPNNLAAKKEILKRYKTSARNRNYEFNLTFEEFTHLITDSCYYCGIEHSMTSPLKRYESFTYNGIDRLNNELGYTVENCVPCCKICNNSKAGLTLTEWKNWLIKLHSKLIKI